MHVTSARYLGTKGSSTNSHRTDLNLYILWELSVARDLSVWKLRGEGKRRGDETLSLREQQIAHPASIVRHE